jgi:flagellar basal body-associated protein FliL
MRLDSNDFAELAILIVSAIVMFVLLAGIAIYLSFQKQEAED